jgi:PhoH-like ATPase
MTKKVFILDTNVLIHDPQAFTKFDENDVCIPIVVISELDGLKVRPDNVGRNARLATKNLEQTFRKLDVISNPDSIITVRVKLPNKGSLGVIIDKFDDEAEHRLVGSNINDDLIIYSASKMASSTTRVVIVSKDTNLRLKALSRGLEAEDYENDKVCYEELYTGRSEIEVGDSLFAEIASGSSELKDEIRDTLSSKDTFPNQFFTVKNTDNPSQSVLAVITSSKEGKKSINLITNNRCGKIAALNRDQTFAIKMLLDPEIKLVTLLGGAGTGKTLLAIAAAIQQTPVSYRKILIARPVVPMGNELGFLPGTLEEKLNPWMQPIYDNLDIIFSSTDKSKTPKRYFELIEQGILNVQALAYIRGRSLPNQFIIIDEAQNLTPHEIKTILTRAGKNSKVVLTGDPDQIDNPYVDTSSNALSYVIERFKEQRIAGHISLRTGVRSSLATIASKIL